jgi:hypothetical protein
MMASKDVMLFKPFRYVAVFLVLAMCEIPAPCATEADAGLNDWTIVPGKRAGPITPKTTRADLIRFFGAKNVQEADIVSSDGGRELGTIVFGEQPDASLGLLWLDETPDAHVRGIVFCHGSELAEKCRWRTEERVSFGTDLKTLERLNGRKFKLNGFDWGYGGLITSWEGGRLDRLSAACGRVTLRLDPSPGTPSDERSSLIEQVEDNDEFWSSDPPMQGLNPSVDHMSMSFRGCNK